MNPVQLVAVKKCLYALGAPPEMVQDIMRICRGDAPVADVMIKTREAAAILGNHPKTLFRYRRMGLLHSVKRTARCIRWRKSEVERLANGGAQ